MRRSELEHLIRAAAAITDQYEIMIVGSQSILGAIQRHRTPCWSQWRRTSIPCIAPILLI